MATRLSRPRITGTTNVSPLYNVMGTGVHQSVLLIGHATTSVLQEPYPVIDVKEALRYLGGHWESPLARALLEVYNTGCKDIWLFAAAPMSEYVSNPSERFNDVGTTGLNFYELYHSRLTASYELLKSYDFYDIIVPLEAPFYDTGDVDFCGQLTSFCEDSFMSTGQIALGVMGTRVPNLTSETTRTTNYNPETIQEMIDDPRIAAQGGKGKFVMIMAGEGVFIHPQAAATYSRSLEAVTAGLLSVSPLDRSISGLYLPDVMSLTQPEFRDDQVEALAQAQINTVKSSAMGKRGFPYQIKIITDNTLGETESDFWSMSQMRVVAAVGNEIRRLGYEFIGEPSAIFKESVKSYLDTLRNTKMIVNYELRITMETPHKAIVEVGILPLFGIRNIAFVVETGPGA